MFAFPINIKHKHHTCLRKSSSSPGFRTLRGTREAAALRTRRGVGSGVKEQVPSRGQRSQQHSRPPPPPPPCRAPRHKLRRSKAERRSWRSSISAQTGQRKARPTGPNQNPEPRTGPNQNPDGLWVLLFILTCDEAKDETSKGKAFKMIRC